MKYTDKTIKLELMHHLAYTEQQADRLIELYRRNEKLDDLMAAVEAKKEVSSRL